MQPIRELVRCHPRNFEHTHSPTYVGTTAQTNFIDGVELEGDFFSYCDNLIDERDDLCY